MRTHGVMGMLDRILDPSAAALALSFRPEPELSLEAPGFDFGVSSTRRRNCALFMVRDV